MTQTLHSLLRAVGLPVPAGLANPALGMLSCDSRSVARGSLFLGLPGERIDGGNFWPQAFAAGAQAAVISQAAAALQPPTLTDTVVVVPEPVSLWVGKLAAAFWQQPSAHMALIGVTGTNGKTTITHLIEHLSAAVGMPTALFGTLVNRWPNYSATATHTTAFADRLQAQLAKAVEAGAQLGAMEVSSHALDQQRVAGCCFAGAVFTNLTQDHLDYHPSMQAYFEAKALLFAPPLFESSSAKRVPAKAVSAKGVSAKAVVNIDDRWGALLAQRLGKNCWRSSLAEGVCERAEAELTITDLTLTTAGVQGRLISPSGEGLFRSPLFGRFNLMNLLQAVGVLLQQDLPLPSLLEAIADFPGVPGRMERVLIPEADAAQLPTVLVDYAHTPDGLENALAASRPFTSKNLCCVFGCGGDRDRGKRAQMAAIAARFADRVVVTSDNPRTEDPDQILADVVAGIPEGTVLSVERDRAKAIAVAIAEADAGDVVLVAGKGHEDYQILGTTKVHFDDREQAEQALRRRLDD
ncbi:MAG TPA: UDP-N-acetylmuramoyl-L-alanyl-D-glutamate--2,6-diaminopimelate ligase [Prochlorococcus sp.]